MNIPKLLPLNIDIDKLLSMCEFASCVDDEGIAEYKARFARRLEVKRRSRLLHRREENERRRLSRKVHSVEINAKRREHRAENKDRINAYSREYNRLHRAEITARRRARYAARKAAKVAQQLLTEKGQHNDVA